MASNYNPTIKWKNENTVTKPTYFVPSPTGLPVTQSQVQFLSGAKSTSPTPFYPTQTGAPTQTTIRSGGGGSSGGSTGGSVLGASTYSVPTTISSKSLSGSSGSINLASPTPLSNPGASMVSAGNAGLINGMTDYGFTQDANGMWVMNPTDTTEQNVDKKPQTLMEKLGLSVPKKESVLDSPEIQAQNRIIEQRQAEVNNATAQLNTIVAKQQQDLLSVRGTGSKEGVTEAVYGGQQAQINREAAIAALPIQAQLAAAQGNLQLAESHLNTLYKLKVEEVDNEYNYRKMQFDAIKEYVTGVEKRQLDAMEKQNDRAYDEKRYEIELADGIARDALNVKKVSSVQDDGSVQYYTQLLSQGKITLANVPTNIRNQVVEATQGIINKPLSDTALTKINDTNFAISSLNDLRAKIQGKTDQIGPITGLEALNPWSPKRQLQADIDRVRQTVGKALEGGVLRKEDEEKYKKILATITDTPETALYKIDALITSIQSNIEDYKSLQAESGRFVPTKSGTTTSASAGTTSSGNSYTITKE